MEKITYTRVLKQIESVKKLMSLAEESGDNTLYTLSSNKLAKLDLIREKMNDITCNKFADDLFNI